MTGSPISNSNPINPAPGAVRIETQQVVNGFKVSADGLSAARDVTIEGKNLTITMFFPSGTTKAERETRLTQFSQAKLESSAKTAIALGVGTKQVSVKFTQDARGNVTTERIKNGQAKKIEDYFRDKTTKANSITNETDKQRKLSSIASQQRAITNMQTIWQGRNSQSNQTRPERREDANSVNPINQPTRKESTKQTRNHEGIRNPFKRPKQLICLRMRKYINKRK
ncbi:MAG: hypothetical protein HWD61_06685 [Parachlamydiaceae bacterium]|nr:MAG: hypothetical protein HWD61_06685 [Parachlamydiaceae bacterium]